MLGVLAPSASPVPPLLLSIYLVVNLCIKMNHISLPIVRRTALIQDVIRLIQMAETKISQAISLKTKFDWNFEKVEDQAETDDKEAVSQQMRNFVKDLFSKSEVNAIGAARGPVGKKIYFFVFCISLS